MGGLEAPVGGVGLGGGGVAASQLEAGGGLPVVGEAADLLEVVGGEGVAPVGEHAAAADRGQLVGIADADQPPVRCIGQARRAGRDPRWRPSRPRPGPPWCPPAARMPDAVWPAVAVEEPGQGGRWAAGLAGEHVGGLARRRQPDDRCGPGRAGRRCQRGAWSSCRRRRGRRRAPAGACPLPRRGRGGLGVARRAACAERRQRPDAAQRNGAGFLVEDGPGGEAPVGDVLADRPAVDLRATAAAGGWVQSEAAAGRLRGELGRPAPPAAGRSRQRRLVGGWRSPGPGRPAARSTTLLTDPVRAPRRPPPPGRGGRGSGAGGCGRRQRQGVEAERRRSAAPLGAQGLGVAGRFLVPGRLDSDGFAFQAGDRPGVGIDAVVFVGPAADQLGELGLDLGRRAGRTRPISSSGRRRCPRGRRPPGPSRHRGGR